MQKTVALAVVVMAALTLAACLPKDNKPLPSAAAVFEAEGGSSVRGRITLGDQEGVTRIFVDLTGLTGEHGFHIHEESDCRAAMANLRKGPFNPEKKPYGQYVGNLPNIKSDVYGTFRDAVYVRNVPLTGPNSVIGRTVVITSRFDDYKTPPNGNSGQVIACGVIKGV